MTNFWCVIIGYFLGAIPTGYLLVWGTRGEDIRAVGSGNIGATNVVRAAGFRLGLAVLAIDAAKGYLSVWTAGQISGGSASWMSAAAVAVMLGNTFPVFLNFHGGKGFATAAGAMLCLSPVATAALLVVFLGTAAASRHISAGSIVTSASAPLAVWLIEHPHWGKVLAVGLIAALIIFRHKENIRRLREGSESRFSFHRPR